MEVLLYTILTLCVLGILSAVILYVVAQKFRVEEDPRIDEVEKMLPGANCGGCGFAGCRGMADALVKQDDISSLFCPVGGGDTMKAVAAYLGKAAPEKEPQVATVRCGGTCEKRPRTNEYNGARSCAVASSLYIGETGCAFGCLGYGDCVAACTFGAITIDPATGLPVVDPDKCTACGACVKACPKKIIELRKKWPKKPCRLRVVRLEGQGCCGDEGLQGRMYRLRQVREGLRLRCHHRREQPRLHRPAEVQTLPQVRERVPHGSHSARRHGAPAQGAQGAGCCEGCPRRCKSCSGCRKGCTCCSEGCSGCRKGRTCCSEGRSGCRKDRTRCPEGCPGCRKGRTCCSEGCSGCRKDRTRCCEGRSGC